ncbi:MAG: hypothetical protein HGGPFJEG_01024 [Ignavibacteria bacterium]|nr:hypothetical protein [Ignavibacteria bacterium]
MDRIEYPKDSDVYTNHDNICHLTLKGSDAYRKSIAANYATPKGSYVMDDAIFYKHQIPSGLLQTVFPTENSLS